MKSNLSFIIPNALIISYPKAGRTWARMLLAKYAEINKMDLSKEMVASGHWSVAEALNRHDLTKKKIIYLSRDPRDIVISLYFEWTHRKKKFKGTLSQFIANYFEEPIHHYNQWSRTQVKIFHEIRYEDLHSKTNLMLKLLILVLGMDYRKDVIKRIIEECSFDKMREIEKQGGGLLADYKGHFGKHFKSDDPESFRVRKGKVGGYVDYMTPEDIEYCNERMKTLCINK